MSAETKRCAIYTRKSSEEGLEQSFNSLDAQREACAAYVASQRLEGWKALETLYDDGGYSGGTMERPGLQALLKDIGAGKVDVIVVYKVDRLTRSLSDFARMVELFDREGVSFVSVTQQFNTTTSMGRLTLNVLLSFAQFEREVTGERIRDKIAASKKKGLWMGGSVPLGYDAKDRSLVRNENEAKLVRLIYKRYLELGCVRKLQADLKAREVLSKVRVSGHGRTSGGVPYSRGALYSILRNRLYIGEIAHRGAVHAGKHEPIVERAVWDSVQQRLTTNSDARRTGTAAKAPSLLAGFVYDVGGHRLTPLHSTKAGKRYRYYTSQRLIRNGPERTDEPLRIPAHELEQIVTNRLRNFLDSSTHLLAAAGLPGDAASVQQTIARAGSRIAGKVLPDSGPECRRFLTAVVTRIVVAQDRVAIRLGKRALRRTLGVRGVDAGTTETLAPSADRGDEIALEVEAAFRRLSGTVRMILPPALASPAKIPNDVLLKAIARARRWYEWLASGTVPSLDALARKTGLHVRYVGRVLPCAFLAPQVVTAIAEGRQPAHLTLDRLLRGFPVDWNEQGRVLLLGGPL